MNTTKEQMKARALEIMKRLDIFKPISRDSATKTKYASLKTSADIG